MPRRAAAADAQPDLEVAERNYDLNRAAELRHGRLPILEKQLETEEALIAKNLGGTRLLREQVTEDEIATIVSKWTGIPLTRLIEGELKTPDTWEVALSSGADKKQAWERLLREKKLGGLALLRNLRSAV